MSKTKAKLYRDSRGRIRNANKITRENQERLYRGESVQVKPVFIKEISTKRTKVSPEGKTIVYFEKSTQYVYENGRKASAENFQRWQYLKGLHPDKGKEFTSRQAQRWDIIPEIRNKIMQGNSVKLNGKNISAGNLYEELKNIRKKITDSDKDEEGEYDIIFEIVEDRNTGDITITSFSSLEENEE